MSQKIIEIRSTGMGAFTFAYPIDSTVVIETRWGKTHGQQRITGYGLYFLRDISNLGNHRCRVVRLNKDGSEEIVEQNEEPVRFCPLCEKYADTIEKFRREQEQ